MTSPQQTIEQERAAHAWDAIQADVKNKEIEKAYKPLAAGSPADIQINGLGQTLAFWLAKANSKKPKPQYSALYKHVSGWVAKRLKKEGIEIPNNDLLNWVISTATTEQYRRATAEASAYLLWLKRFAEGHLEGELHERGD
jgi:CRISPR-associated protein Cmr5